MVIAVCAFALDLRPPGPAGPGVGTGIGSAGPTPLRATAAEEFLAGTLAEGGLWESAARLPHRSPNASANWWRRPRSRSTTCAAPPPIAGTALSVLARRTLAWAWTSFQSKGGPRCG